MDWAAERRVIELAVNAMRGAGVPATARNVETVVNTVEQGPVAARIAGFERKLAAPEHRGLIVSVDTETGEIGSAGMAPEPYFARHEGQDDFATELAKLKAKARELQATVDDSSIDRVTRERALLELTQIRVRMAAIEAATAPSQTQMARPTIRLVRDGRGQIVGATKA